MSHKTVSRIGRTALLAAALCLSFAIAQAADIVSHPEQLTYPELNYQPPKADQFRQIGRAHV